MYNAISSFCLSFSYTAMAWLNQLKSEIKAEWHRVLTLYQKKLFMYSKKTINASKTLFSVLFKRNLVQIGWRLVR